MEKTKKEIAKLETSVATLDLKTYANVGMSKVDPQDIRPPQIILVQKSSDLSVLQDAEGNTAKVGQFYHTGKKQIRDQFNCHILFAAKGTYVDRRKVLPNGEHPIIDQYKVIGVLNDLSMFGMNFRSTALWALSSLFTASNSQKMPMFAFNLVVESKLLKGEKGDWYVPVVRVGQVEEDPAILKKLLEMAVRFDANADKIVSETEEEEPTTEVIPEPKEELTEDVEPSEIPF